MITEKEKSIYNCFLKHFRNGEPYQIRKNFDNLSPNIILDLKKISNLFNKFPNINWDDFFGSYTFINPNDNCPNLNFFTTRAAIKYYNLAKQKKELSDPKNQIDKILEGFKFIGMFCLKQNIKLEDYLKHKNGLTYSWIKHYNENLVNPYCLISLGDIEEIIKNIDDDIKNLYIKNFIENIKTFKLKYYTSPSFQEKIKKSKKIVDDFVKKNLKNPKNTIT